MIMGEVEKLTVFYDGACPLCEREIAFYRRGRGAEDVSWVDVSGGPEGEVAPGLSRVRARARFHVKRPDGTLLSGGRAFAELWLALPAFRALGVLARPRPVAWILDRAYDLFLKFRPRIQSLARQSRSRKAPGSLGLHHEPASSGGSETLGNPRLGRRRCVKSILSTGLLGATFVRPVAAWAGGGEMLIDDFADDDFISNLGTRWRGVSDEVMGGVSKASVARDLIDGRPCLRLTGDVRLENDGGFIQAALDLERSGGTFDASGYRGLRLVVRGNGEQYSLHLRTPDNVRPWQSYRAHFSAGPEWRTVDLAFEDFTPYRLETPLDRERLKRIGLVAIGRAFSADLAVAGISLYR